MHAHDLDGTSWFLEYLTLDGVSHMVTGREAPVLEFAEGRLSMDDGVNRGGGPYELAAGAFTAGPLTSTRLAYPADELPEHRLFSHMDRVDAASVHGSFLHLRFDGGELVYRLREEPEEPA